MLFRIVPKALPDAKSNILYLIKRTVAHNLARLMKYQGIRNIDWHAAGLNIILCTNNIFVIYHVNC